MSMKTPSSATLARSILLAALIAPLMVACGKKEEAPAAPTGSAQQPGSPPMSSPPAAPMSPPPAAPSDSAPPASSSPPSGESPSSPSAPPAGGSEPAK